MSAQQEINEIKRDLAGLNGKLDQITTLLNAPVEKLHGEEKSHGGPKRDTDKDLKKFQKRFDEGQAEIAALRAEMEQIKAREKQRARGVVDGGKSSEDSRSWAEIILGNKSVRAVIERDAKSSAQIILPFSMKDISAVDLTGAPPAEQRYPMWIEDPAAPLLWESFIPSFNTESSTFKIVKESQEYAIQTEADAAVGSGDSTLTVDNARGFKSGATVYVGDSTSNSAVISSITYGASAKDSDTITLTGVTGFTASKGARVWSTDFIPVASGKRFPYGEVVFTPETVDIERVGSIIPVHLDALEDTAMLQALLVARVRRSVLVKSQSQILNGNGTSPQLDGLLNRSGRNTYSWSGGSSGDTKLDAIRRAMTTCRVDFYYPDLTVLASSDFEDVEMTPGTDGHYVYAQAQNSDGIKRAWGARAFEDPGLTAGTGVTGAFTQAAIIANRKNLEVVISTEHDNFFSRDMAAIKARRRMGVGYLREDAFCEITFDSAPS